MSDNDVTATPAETTFGIDVKPILDAYDKAVDQAARMLRLVRDEIDGNLSEAENAIRKVIGYGKPTTSHLIGMLRALSDESDVHIRACKAYEEALAAAEDAKAKALGADPFTRYVSTTFAEEQGDYRANTILRNAPYTFASLHELAEQEDWCTEFETLALRALRAGAIPDDTVEVRHQVSRYQVPEEYGAKPGETWERIFQVYAFTRTSDSYGDPHSYSHLRRYSHGDPVFVKVADAPVDTETTSDDENPEF
jgi:hypothetical protein